MKEDATRRSARLDPASGAGRELFKAGMLAIDPGELPLKLSRKLRLWLCDVQAPSMLLQKCGPTARGKSGEDLSEVV